MKPRGSLLLPRQVADHGQANWPKCALCLRAVDAYGLENDTPAKVEIWARCTGVRIDPRTGGALAGAPRVHDTMQSSVTIRKGPGWSENRQLDTIRRMAFFARDGERGWAQTLTPEGVKTS